jgi:hypothetical protein
MPTLEQQKLPCHDTCPFQKEGVRLCGLGYEGRKVKKSNLAGTLEAIEGRQRLCRDTITSFIDQLDYEKPEDAAFTDGDMTMPHMLTISYHTVERGLIPIAGIVNGEFCPIPQLT